MARLNQRSISSDEESTPSSCSVHRTRNASETPPSPVLSTSSDKENRDQTANSRLRTGKRKSSAATMTTPSSSELVSANKRRRIEARSQPGPSQSQRAERVDKQYYDPDQDESERRAVKKRMRETYREFNDKKAEYMKGPSDGITRTLSIMDQNIKEVKNTSDATIDSRQLVDVSDVAKRKVTELTLGDSSVGVDVDDFVTKCKDFMRRGAEGGDARVRQGSAISGGTQTQRWRRQAHEEVEDEEEENGDALDWEYLGRNACFLYNSRPCLSGFLLGPLSVQKKVRQQTQRRAREVRANPANAVRPLQMLDEDLEKQESTNLTALCKEIARLLERVILKGTEEVEKQYEDEMGPDEMQDLMRSNGIADNGQVPLFDFCVNPKSFGQTVENMFYVSFLIKEGSVGFDFDSRGLPTLGPAEAKTLEQRQETPKNQAVFTLDFETWEAIVESHGIKESIIPHRVEEDYDDGTGENRNGWYE